MKPDTLLIGATGFIGSALVRATRNSEEAHLRLFVREITGAALLGHEYVAGDLRDPTSLTSALRGIHTVIHAASYIGPDPQLCVDVNQRGTENLVAAAEKAGVQRLIYVSTTAVYGIGFHAGTRDGEITPEPESVRSRSRMAAEHAVLNAGGLVVRPNIVYGTGDRWAIPGLVRFTHALDALVNNGRAQVSVIHVDDLARLLAQLAIAEGPPSPSVFHATDAAKTSILGILNELVAKIGLRLPRKTVSSRDALEVAARLDISESQFGMISTDRWYDSSRLWEATGFTPTQGFQLSGPDVIWYLSVIAESAGHQL